MSVVITTNHKNTISEYATSKTFEAKEFYITGLGFANGLKMEDMDDVTQWTISIKIEILRVNVDDAEIEETKWSDFGIV